MKIEQLVKNKQFLYILKNRLFKINLGITSREAFKVRKYYIIFIYKLNRHIICLHRRNNELECIYEEVDQFISRFNIKTTKESL